MPSIRAIAKARKKSSPSKKAASATKEMSRLNAMQRKLDDAAVRQDDLVKQISRLDVLQRKLDKAVIRGGGAGTKKKRTTKRTKKRVKGYASARTR